MTAEMEHGGALIQRLWPALKACRPFLLLPVGLKTWLKGGSEVSP